MALFKNQGDPALNLAEECAEVIQVITKLYRFQGSWNEIPPGKTKTRLETLTDEMADLMLAYNRLMDQINENSKTNL